MIIFVLIAAMVQLLFAIRLSRASSEGLIPGLFCLILLPFFVTCFVLIYSPLVLVQSIVLVSALTYFRMRSLPAKHFGLVGFGGTLALFAVFSYLAAENVHAVRRAHPIVDLTDRLRYESRQASILQTVPLLSERSEARLGAQEADYTENRSWRVHQLRRLHTNFVSAFSNSMGFGVGRMVRLNDEPLPPLEPVASSAPPPPEPTSASEETSIAASRFQNEPDPEITSLHEEAVGSFLPNESFGWIAGPRQAADFMPHGFHTRSEQPRTAPELVSLIKHDPPGVYLSTYLPKMDELTNAPVRPLDAFETEALTRLRAGEDIVVLTTTRGLRMLGAIRAARQCLDCHSVSRGQLLGAFSYRLPPTNDREKPPAGTDPGTTEKL